MLAASQAAIRAIITIAAGGANTTRRCSTRIAGNLGALAVGDGTCIEVTHDKQEDGIQTSRTATSTQSESVAALCASARAGLCSVRRQRCAIANDT